MTTDNSAIGDGDRAAIDPSTVLSKDGSIAVLTLDSPPVNALSEVVRRRLVDGLCAAKADAGVRAVVIIGAGRGFSGGADITEFGKPPRSPALHEVLCAIERLSKPVVAALHGMALGGGLELALTCPFRVAAPDARLGLPEVKLGLLPGAGGTQRLPRVVGVPTALDMIVSGDPIHAETALRTGLLDEIVSGDLRTGAVAFARRIVEAGPRPIRTRDREDKLASARADPDLFDRFKAANARRLHGFAAPVTCIEAVRAAVQMPFADGLKLERRLFLELLQGPQSAALRYAFFAER